jgi:hypothetical protein
VTQYQFNNDPEGETVSITEKKNPTRLSLAERIKLRDWLISARDRLDGLYEHEIAGLGRHELGIKVLSWSHVMSLRAELRGQNPKNWFIARKSEPGVEPALPSVQWRFAQTPPTAPPEPLPEPAPQAEPEPVQEQLLPMADVAAQVREAQELLTQAHDLLNRAHRTLAQAA